MAPLVGRLWKLSEMTTMLDTTPEAVLAASDDAHLLPLTLRDGKTLVWPEFQLVASEGELRTGLPGMRALLEVVRGCERISPWATAGWLCSPEPLLTERRPADVMRVEGATLKVLDCVWRWCAPKSRWTARCGPPPAPVTIAPPT